jgi:antitoxin component of MazEF toxin-antitoxin module
MLALDANILVWAVLGKRARGILEACAGVLKVSREKIVLTPVRAPQYTLAELLAGVKKGNLHRDFQSGPALGKEAW